MERFTKAVEESIKSENWYGALTLALTLPDICGRLEKPQELSGKRFQDWWDEYLLPTYQRRIGRDQELHTFLSARDAYALRCAYLHEGGDDITSQKAKQALDSFHFIAPIGDSYIHRNQNGAVLQLQVDIFCSEICAGVLKWEAKQAANSDVQRRKADLLTIHDVSGGFSF